MSTNYKDIQTYLVKIPFVLKTYIQTKIATISAKYTYIGEKRVNPAFQSIAQVNFGLQLNEKRAFVLRSDFTIATGVKNDQTYNYRSLEKFLAPSVHHYVNWEDRYGHPSLAIASGDYDGKVYYAGFVCQRGDYLEIFLSSGRFNRINRTDEGIDPLSEEQLTIIEAYLALQFCRAYGNQKVVFYDTLPGKQDDEDSALFFTDTPFPKNKKSRSYTSEAIVFAAEQAKATLNFTKAENYILNNITTVKPQYPSYPNEESINPAFQNIEQVHYPLQYLEKRIWAFRSDFNLVTGVKNAYQKEYGYHGLTDSFSESIHQFLNWKDRYGHPSLTIAEGDYNGEVFYAGYVCQRKDYLQVYLASGRFDRNDLNEKQRAILEAYIAAKFQVAYGKQEIVFDYADPNNTTYHTTFFGNGIFPKENPQRKYTQDSIKEILASIPQLEDSETLITQLKWLS